jgi:hypothetical protein
MKRHHLVVALLAFGAVAPGAGASLLFAAAHLLVLVGALSLVLGATEFSAKAFTCSAGLFLGSMAVSSAGRIMADDPRVQLLVAAIAALGVLFVLLKVLEALFGQRHGRQEHRGANRIRLATHAPVVESLHDRAAPDNDLLWVGADSHVVASQL